MKKFAKILVLILSVALVLGAAALAIGAEETGAYSYTGANGAATAGTLAEAMANSTDGKITLTKDVETAESLALSDGVALDLGGFKVTNTNAEVALFTTNGTVTITNGTVESASQLLVNAESGSLTVTEVSGFARLGNTNYLGVTALPDYKQVADGVTYTDDGNLSVLALYQINHSDNTTTYFGTAAEFTQLWAYQSSETSGYYITKTGDTIVMNDDITFTGDLNNLYTSTATDISFTLDVNGNTLDTLGYDLVRATDSMGGRDVNFRFTITSSKVGGVINSARHYAEGGASEALVSDPLLYGLCGKKNFVINGAVDGVNTLTINTGCLFASETFGSNNCGSTHLVINGGMYNMVAFPATNTFGFISLSSGLNPSGNPIPNAGDVTINNATIVQAYYSPKDANGQHGTLDYNDGQSSVNYFVPELFHFGAANAFAAKANETALSTTEMILTNCTVIGRTPDSTIVSSKLLTGEVRFNNCKISADIAPKDCKVGTTYDFSGRGRVVLDNNTVFTNCSKQVKDYDGGAVAGVFAPVGSVLVRDVNAASISLPNVPSAIAKDNAIAFNRPWVIGCSNSFTGGEFGVFNGYAGHYFLAEAGVAATDIVTEADVAASYTYNGVTENAGNKEDRLVINLGLAEYSFASGEAFDGALFYIKYANGAYYIGENLDNWQKVMEGYVVNYPNASGSITISGDAAYGMTAENTVDLNGDGKYTEADYDGRFDSILEDGATIVLQNDITYTQTIRAQLGELQDITIDLNGHTVDITKSTLPFLRVGSSSAGKGNGNHNGSIGVTIKSSVAGGKVITRQDSQGLFLDVLGDAKYIDVIGTDEEGNTSLTVETPRLVYQNTIASGCGRTDAYVKIDGGYYIQTPGETSYAFITQRAASSSGIHNYAEFVMQNATIESNSSTSWIFSQMRTGNAEDQTNTQLVKGATFENCSININEGVSFAGAGYAEANVTIIDTAITGAESIGLASAGKIVIGTGCEFNGFKVTPLAYDADAIATYDGTNKGIYYGAADIQLVKTVGEQTWTLANADETKQVQWLFGEQTATEWYLVSAEDVSSDAPFDSLTTNELGSQVITWNESEVDGVCTYTGTADISWNEHGLKVSAYLHTNLAINIYLNKAFALNCTTEGLNFVETADPNVYVATVKLDGNEAFRAVISELTFSLGAISGEMIFDSTISLYNYIGKIITDTNYTTAERDLMWYMVDYLNKAYTYMGLSDMEIEALESADLESARASAAVQFATLLEAYTPAESYTASTDELGGSIGVSVAVDLTTVPRFVITLNDAEFVEINGQAAEDGTNFYCVDGVYYYEVENLLAFNDSFTVETDVAAADLSLAHYYNTALADTEHPEVAGIVEALYKYILSAEAYANSLQ